MRRYDEFAAEVSGLNREFDQLDTDLTRLMHRSKCMADSRHLYQSVVVPDSELGSVSGRSEVSVPNVPKPQVQSRRRRGTPSSTHSGSVGLFELATAGAAAARRRDDSDSAIGITEEDHHRIASRNSAQQHHHHHQPSRGQLKSQRQQRHLPVGLTVALPNGEGTAVKGGIVQRASAAGTSSAPRTHQQNTRGCSPMSATTTNSASAYSNPSKMQRSTATTTAMMDSAIGTELLSSNGDEEEEEEGARANDLLLDMAFDEAEEDRWDRDGGERVIQGGSAFGGSAFSRFDEERSLEWCDDDIATSAAEIDCSPQQRLLQHQQHKSWQRRGRQCWRRHPAATVPLPPVPVD